MIPEYCIESWRKNIPWQMNEQIEQDLIISRALVDLYNDPHIKETLVFRGGTALNKVFINPPARYSEDIDFVQKQPDPIGQTIDAIRKLLKPWMGDPKWKITQRGAKLIYKYESANKIPAKLKIEINTTEHFQVLPLKIVPFSVDSVWFEGTTDIITYEIDELMATKLRALYQRRKGRDLFDIWYAADRKLINLDRVFDIFSKYNIYNDVKISREEFLNNIELKKNHRDFHMDMSVLLPSKLHWDFDEAYQFVVDNVISRLP
jgi:predicted nucleotidyltransferase component of viral defense system